MANLIGGVVAKKCQDINPDLGSLRHNFLPSQTFRETSSWFIDGMNTGGLLYPSQKFFIDLQIWNERFERFHPKNGLDKGHNIVSNFAKVLKHYFPSYDIKVLETFSKIRTGIQIRKMNALISKYQKLSVRGRCKNAEYAAQNN